MLSPNIQINVYLTHLFSGYIYSSKIIVISYLVETPGKNKFGLMPSKNTSP